MIKINFIDAGRIGYGAGLTLQQNIHKNLTEHKLKIRKQGLSDSKPLSHLILCEHDPVFTLGKSGKESNLLFSDSQLSDRGIEYYPTNRGGDITYHGPGQIVGYPIFDLDDFYHDVHRFVRDIEEVIIKTMKHYYLECTRLNGLTGVWIQDTNNGSFRKICAIGVHISRWVTMHGFALNVNTDLNYFEGIIPCGISDRDKTVTSMQEELGMEIDIQQVKNIIVKKFIEVFGIEFNNVSKFIV
ncbi:MAG: lipoyl(octanoyl) transferase LipB [Deltaproteobacteria bacterium]